MSNVQRGARCMTYIHTHCIQEQQFHYWRGEAEKCLNLSNSQNQTFSTPQYFHFT
jgi:hypothetical protein